MISKILLAIVSVVFSSFVAANCYDEFASDLENFTTCSAQAEQGEATAQYVLATLYNNGQGVEKNSQKAVEWYRKSAEQNNDLAQYSLGVMYEFGDVGLEKNQEEAKKWYTLAAENGNYFAQNKLGMIEQINREYPTTITPYTGEIPSTNSLPEDHGIIEQFQNWLSNIIGDE